jgi:hypothetical protein
MGHDIYSLGVCLLEIGLWDTLIREESTGQAAASKPRVSELVRVAAEVDGQLNPEAALKVKLERPTDVKNILLKLARENLPQRMGLGYCRLVVACLTGLDQPSGFGQDINLLTMNDVEQGVAFKDLVLSFFTDLPT